jgi:PQQ-dependent catabolism-associated CXXCW motif protein
VTGRAAAALLLALLSCHPVRGEEALFDAATGYRIARYRAPVVEPPPGAKRIALEDLDRLVAREKAVLLDVTPSDGGGPDPATGAWRTVKPHHHIPGSVWLPDVGKGTLEARLERYFRAELARLTAGDSARPLIVYCQADCWMAWNAAKRAASYGYSAVHWYPEGRDGFTDDDRPLAPATPLPVPAAD